MKLRWFNDPGTSKVISFGIGSEFSQRHLSRCLPRSASQTAKKDGFFRRNHVRRSGRKKLLGPWGWETSNLYTSGRWHRFSRTYPKNHLWTCHLFDASAHTLSLMHMSSARWTPKFLWCVLRKKFSEHTSKTLEGPLSRWQVLSPLCALPLFVGEIQNVRKPAKMKDKPLSIVFPFWCVFIQLLARSWFWWMTFFYSNSN